MKIIAATCNRNGSPRSATQNYIANIRVKSDEIQFDGIGYGDDPDTALHQALSEAVGKFAKPLHDSIRAEIAVKF